MYEHQVTIKCSEYFLLRPNCWRTFDQGSQAERGKEAYRVTCNAPGLQLQLWVGSRVCKARGNGQKWLYFLSWAELSALLCGRKKRCYQHTVTLLLVFDWVFPSEFSEKINRCEDKDMWQILPWYRTDSQFLMLFLSLKYLLIFSYTLCPFVLQDLYLWRSVFLLGLYVLSGLKPVQISLIRGVLN